MTLRISTLLIAAIFYYSDASTQLIIELPNDLIEVENQNFYVSKVEDLRSNKVLIGTARKGISNKSVDANFQNSLENELKLYFDSYLPKETGFSPITIKVNTFEISESGPPGGEMCKLDWNIDFFLDNQFISKYYSPESVSVSNAEKNHGENIRNGFIHAFESLAQELNKQGIATNSDKDSAKNKTEETEEDDYLTSFDRDKYASKLNAITNRDVKALGYQIGGFNLIGFDYEYRVSDILGVHFGAGLVGYTGGIKVHSNAEKMGPFFNLSWKDAGFGQMNGVGLEYGSHLGLSKKSDFGLMLQLGLFGITHITRQFRQTIFGASRPALIFSFGLGFAW